MSAFVGNVHLAAGNAEDLAHVLALLEREGISTHANPDLYARAYRSFGIDEARELGERAALRAAGKRRVFVVAAPALTAAAQNALLKTLEEAPGDALFVFLVPSPETLLPTLRSRAQALALPGAGAPLDVGAFLKASPARRLELLKPLVEKGSDDKRDLGAILAFLAALERALASRPDALRAVYRARKYATDRGALLKPLLEQIALLVPQT